LEAAFQGMTGMKQHLTPTVAAVVLLAGLSACNRHREPAAENAMPSSEAAAPEAPATTESTAPTTNAMEPATNSTTGPATNSTAAPSSSGAMNSTTPPPK